MRLFDPATSEKLSQLHRYSIEYGRKLAVVFDGEHPHGAFWIAQVFSSDERDVITGRGTTYAAAISQLHERWLARNGRHC